MVSSFVSTVNVMMTPMSGLIYAEAAPQPLPPAASHMVPFSVRDNTTLPTGAPHRSRPPRLLNSRTTTSVKVGTAGDHPSVTTTIMRIANESLHYPPGGTTVDPVVGG